MHMTECFDALLELYGGLLADENCLAHENNVRWIVIVAIKLALIEAAICLGTQVRVALRELLEVAQFVGFFQHAVSVAHIDN